MFKWLTIAMASKVVFVPIQIAVATSLVTAHIVMFGFVIYALMFFYNQYNELLSLVASMGSNDLLSMTLSVVKAFGVISAFNDVFSIFSPFLIAFLVYKAGVMVFHSFQVTSNEIFKIGVLVQQ